MRVSGKLVLKRMVETEDQTEQSLHSDLDLCLPQFKAHVFEFSTENVKIIKIEFYIYLVRNRLKSSTISQDEALRRNKCLSVLNEAGNLGKIHARNRFVNPLLQRYSF